MKLCPAAYTLFLCTFLFCAAAVPQKRQAGAPYRNPDLPVEDRVSDLLRQMTIEEKASLLSGANWMETVAIERLGIPAIRMADGPMGVRGWFGPSAITNAPGTTFPKIAATAFPVGIAMAATWNPALVEKEGRTIGREAKIFGRDMLLAPTVNIARVPVWGRNFEGYGEDPFLAARMGVAYIKGVQSEGVIATVKHFVANNQEFERHRIDETIDERALHEIYFPAFKAAVQEAGVLSVMSAYNKVNGLYCAENPRLLTDVLRKEWGFKGFVVSDWGGTHSSIGTLNAGLNLEMPGGTVMQQWLANPKTQADGNSGGWLTVPKVMAALKEGKVSRKIIDERVKELLRVMFERGMFDRQPAAGELEVPEQRDLAREAAVESIVLLKNRDEMLPLNLSKIRSIAVIGPNAAVARTGGGGSSQVRPQYAIPPLDGIRARAGAQVRVSYAPGALMEGEAPEKNTPELKTAMRNEASAVASKADVAVIIAGYSPALDSEGFDRNSLDLPAGQEELIRAVAESNRNTVVVIHAGSPVAMSKWLDQAPAVMFVWYGGQEAGNAVADVLFGDKSPSGKLPVSFPKRLEDNPASAYYPGKNYHTEYGEGIYVGYRHYDTKGIEPLYPFGYGLSYTKFEYSDLEIKPKTVRQGGAVEVSLNVRNIGMHDGAEVVQLYISDPECSVDRPVRELKGFSKVFLKKGEMKRVVMKLDSGAMSFYSPIRRSWIAEPGKFELMVGGSSRDPRLRGSFQLK